MEKFKTVEKRIAIAYANLYAVASLAEDELLLEVADTLVSDLDNIDELVSFWHGLEMTSSQAYEYCKALELDITQKEVEKIFAELDTLV